MTIKERLILMEDIKNKNDVAWSKYAKQHRMYWTWAADVKKPFNPFNGIGAKCMLVICGTLMLVMFVKMA